jgi:hypothetical protein
MALNISQLKSRLNSLSSQGSGNSKKNDVLWKPNPGKQVVRIVPYKFNPENPFIELKFHYNINGKTYLSPDSFGRPDPIVEFANRLKKTGSKEDWQMGRKMEPKMRTFAPVIVRGQESEGVKFWGFGKTVYQELVSVCLDPEYGDITDLANGRDITIEFKTAEETGKSFPETTVRVKPNVTPAVDPKNAQLVDSLKNQTNILDLFPELSYDELKDVMDKWLNPETETAEVEVPAGTEAEEEVAETPATVKAAAPSGVKTAVQPKAETKKAAFVSPTASKSKGGSTDVEKAFDDLFNS